MRRIAYLLTLIAAMTSAAPAQTATGNTTSVREIRVSGATAIPQEEIRAAVQEFEGRNLTLDDLETLRLKITRMYVDRGHINSGAILDDSALNDGVVQFRIVEGTLTSIELRGNRWTRSSYIRQRLHQAAGTPLKVGDLQQRLQLFSLDGTISRFNAQLLPGIKPGDSVLRLEVEDRFPVRVFVTYNNYQAPAVGDHRGQITAVHPNVTGFGDSLSVSYGRSSGISPLIDASYTFPVTAYDTMLSIAYRRNNSLVVEEIFQALDITSRTDVLSVGLRQPIFRRLGREFVVAASFERSRNETYLLGEPFSFSRGSQNGRSNISALRLFQDWTSRSQVQVLSVRSRFSIGVDAFASTLDTDKTIADSRFLAWLGQAQYARRVPHDIHLIGRVDLQVTNEPLLPLEQVPVGGRFTVRGYRENQLVRDNGLIASFEARMPVLRRYQSNLGQLEAAMFTDIGHAWNVDIPDQTGLANAVLNKSTLASVGLGLRWSARRAETRGLHPFGEIYWGLPLNRIPTPGGRSSLQDSGFHFQLGLSLP